MKIHTHLDHGFWGSVFRNPFIFSSGWPMDYSQHPYLYDWPCAESPFSVQKHGTGSNRPIWRKKQVDLDLGRPKLTGNRIDLFSDCESDSESESDDEYAESKDVEVLNKNVNNNGIVRRSKECPSVSPSLPNVAPNITKERNSLQCSPTEFDLTQNRRITRSTESSLAKDFSRDHVNDRKAAQVVLSNRRLGSERSVSHRHNRGSSGVTSYMREGACDENYFISDCDGKEKDFFQPEEVQCSAICSAPSYPAYDYLKRILRSEERQIDYIRGDGNCFFRALSKVLYMTEGCHQELRQAVVDLIEKYPREFQQFIDGSSMHDYIVEMRRSGTWATQAEIYAAATLLQREIYVLSPDPSGEEYKWLLFSPRLSHSECTSSDPCYITLCHTNANHYDRIAALDGGCNCPLAPPVLAGVHGHLDLTV